MKALPTVPPHDMKALLGFSYADITPIKPAIITNFIEQINGSESYYLFVLLNIDVCNSGYEYI
jgi:hypothetical protein